MGKTKEAIEKGFTGNKEKCKEGLDIIDTRWESQLHYPLHASCHYLNPRYFYGNSSVEYNLEVMEGLYKCVLLKF